MNAIEYRDMTDRERGLLAKLLAPDFPGRDALAAQLATAQVRVIDEDGCLEFLVRSDEGIDAVKYAVPTEGEYEDVDGVTVHVLLYVTGKKVQELEFYREDNARVRSWPRLEALRVFAPR